MYHVFFATGLPRSRTAWMANWLTTDLSLCWHDKPFDESLLIPGRLVGFSGPELINQFDAIQESRPNSRWIVVLRNENDALLSFRRWAGELLPEHISLETIWQDRCHKISQMCRHPNVKAYHYKDLDDVEKCRELYQWVLPGLEFDEERWKLLNELNVQQDLNKAVNLWHLQQSQA
jgi:hypothetical protein